MGGKGIELFAPGLQDTPGWTDLSPEKQDYLLEHTNRLEGFRKMEGHGIVGQAMELSLIRERLEDEAMGITDYTRTIFKGGWRTAFRRMEDFENIRKLLPEPFIDRLVKDGGTFFRGAIGGGMRELINGVKEVPPADHKVTEPATIEAYFTTVRETMRKRRQERHVKGRNSIDLETAVKSAVNGLLNTMRSAHLETSAERRKWLKRVLGIVMKAQAITGTIHAKPISVPEGTIVRRGPRPKKRTQ